VKPLKYLLFPFAVLYDVITSIRNTLYDRGYKPSAEFDVPVISVGNLAVGGTGKTPMVEYLIRLLSDSYKIVTLSRGYGRSTKGFILANENATAKTIGDEPYQLFKKFEGKVNVAVGEERALAIPYILNELPDIQVIVLDDAFQHRKVKPSFQICLTDYNNIFYKDALLPAGRLRESARGAIRANAIVVTKCPPKLKDEEMMMIEKSIREYADAPIFFSIIRYGYPLPLNRADQMPSRVVLVSGIANHTPFEEHVSREFTVVKHFRFRDHYPYKQSDLQTICRAAKEAKAAVITTEKDAVKFDPLMINQIFTDVPLFYLPIQSEFLKNGKEFDEMLLNIVKKPSTLVNLAI
jgi:tetraacyldisaccharide 4'-kinase